MLHTICHQGNASEKSSESAQPSEWPTSRTRVIPRASKAAEQKELSFTAGGNAKGHRLAVSYQT